MPTARNRTTLPERPTAWFIVERYSIHRGGAIVGLNQVDTELTNTSTVH